MSICEHIQQFDWCAQSDPKNFVDVDDLDNSVIEKILRNKFHDPLISSDSDTEPTPKINWDEVLQGKNAFKKQHRIYVPGLKQIEKHPKLSALKRRQQHQLLKVICAQNPRVLEAETVGWPTKADYALFEELKEVYEKEQLEFIEWAKSLWLSGHNVRALKPSLLVEQHYDAEFQVRSKAMESFPKEYNLAAQIPLESKQLIKMVHEKDIISVDINDLPEIMSTDTIIDKFNVMRPSTLPVPCNKHPCRFVLPTENSTSTLPLTEIHKELAQYCSEHGASIIASEGALQCLVQHDSAWLIPLSVCKCITLDGETKTILVLGSELSHVKHPSQVRTYKALRHLAQYALLPTSERAKIASGWKVKKNVSEQVKCTEETKTVHGENFTETMDESSDDESNLCIDTGEDEDYVPSEDIDSEMTDDSQTAAEVDSKENIQTRNTEKTMDKLEPDCAAAINNLGVYECTCKDTMFESPPPRSYSKWQLKDSKTSDNIDLIVHCAHKVRGKFGEVVIEPIPEYQLELGGSAISQTKAKTLALQLFLRNNASLLTVRIDGKMGDVVRLDVSNSSDLVKTYGDLIPGAVSSIHSALDQLQGLLPGHYVLKHDREHGANALLFASSGACAGASARDGLRLTAPARADEAPQLLTPVLAPVLLPAHKLRSMLPCAFTAQECHLIKENKKPITRQKTPPQAIKWPKKKGRKQRKISN